MRNRNTGPLTFTGGWDRRLTRGADWDEDAEAEEAAEMERTRKRLLEGRPPHVPFDIEEIRRTMPKRRYIRHNTHKPNFTERNDSNLDD